MSTALRHSTRLFFTCLMITLLFLTPNVLGGELLQGSGEIIPNQYIVTLKPQMARNMTFEASSDLPEVAGVAEELLAIHGVFQDEIFMIYENAFEGFAIQMDEESAKMMAKDPRVLFIEPDGIVTISDLQQNATWGIDRVDQKNLPLSKSYEYKTTAANVHAYILDTGLNANHTEFSGRVGKGFDAIGDGDGTNDGNGHGTHVAGTVGGTKYGIAKKVIIHPVQVLGSSGGGTTSGVVAGIDWVTRNHQKPAVANMSLGGGMSSALNKAVENSIAAGVTYAVAAGNSNADACNYSPASVSNALSVGSSTSLDKRSSFSNWGRCVSLFAPGSQILSASHTSNTGSRSLSGTSMASPHVCGVAALYLSNHPNATPKEVKKALLDAATPNKIGDTKGTANKLLYSIFSGSSTPFIEADFDLRANQLSVDFTDQSRASQTTINSWRWSFGDGGRSDLKNPVHTYDRAGTYTINLTVSDGSISDNITQSVTVNNGGSNQIAFEGFESKSYKKGTGWLRKRWEKKGDVKILKRKPYAGGGKYYARMRKNTGYLKRTVDLSNVKSARLKFVARAAYFEKGDKAFVKVRNNDSQTYTIVKEFTFKDSDNRFHAFDIDLAPFLPAKPVRILFESSMSGPRDYWAIDNIEVVGE